MSRREASENVESWDAYLTTIEGRAASVLVNLGLLETAPLPGLDTLHHWILPMQDPGRMGVGSPAEAEGFEAVEEEVTSRLARLGFCPVGRLRYDGNWHMSYYAAGDRRDDLREVLDRVLGNVVEHAQLNTEVDPQWEYYFGFLRPDRQQAQWMFDRDRVLELRRAGDDLSPRGVSHYAYFPSEPEARAFASEAGERGFTCVSAHAEDAVAQLAWMVRAHRHDEIELHAIHVTVMGLVELAEACGGEYDRWSVGDEDDEDDPSVHD